MAPSRRAIQSDAAARSSALPIDGGYPRSWPEPPRAATTAAGGGSVGVPMVRSMAPPGWRSASARTSPSVSHTSGGGVNPVMRPAPGRSPRRRPPTRMRPPRRPRSTRSPRSGPARATGGPSSTDGMGRIVAPTREGSLPRSSSRASTRSSTSRSISAATASWLAAASSPPKRAPSAVETTRVSAASDPPERASGLGVGAAGEAPGQDVGQVAGAGEDAVVLVVGDRHDLDTEAAQEAGHREPAVERGRLVHGQGPGGAGEQGAVGAGPAGPLGAGQRVARHEGGGVRRAPPRHGPRSEPSRCPRR